MKCIKDPELLPEECGGMLSRIENFIKFDTQEEADCYEWVKKHINNADEAVDITSCVVAYYEGYWDCYMTEYIDNDIRDDEVYYYIGLDEAGVEIGGAYTDADGVVWMRVE